MIPTLFVQCRSIVMRGPAHRIKDVGGRGLGGSNQPALAEPARGHNPAAPARRRGHGHPRLREPRHVKEGYYGMIAKHRPQKNTIISHTRASFSHPPAPVSSSSTCAAPPCCCRRTRRPGSTCKRPRSVFSKVSLHHHSHQHHLLPPSLKDGTARFDRLRDPQIEICTSTA